MIICTQHRNKQRLKTTIMTLPRNALLMLVQHFHNSGTECYQLSAFLTDKKNAVQQITRVSTHRHKQSDCNKMCSFQSSTHRQLVGYRQLPGTTAATFNNTIPISVTTQCHDPQDHNIKYQIT